MFGSSGNAKGKGGDKGNGPDVSKLVADSVRKAMSAEQEKIAQICQNVCEAMCFDLGAKLQKSVDEMCAWLLGCLQ